MARKSLAPNDAVGGDFRIVRRLAAGAMGTVFVAEQLSTGKKRALKVMHPQFAMDPRTRERFAQEARAGAGVRSEHVVEVVAAGVDADTGTPWLAMELLEGEDLGQLMQRRGALGPSEAMEAFRQFGHGLAAAHDAGLVHRDLKPENIFLAQSQRADVPYTVKILDFGIAKVLRDSGNRKTQAVGSPLWMSREQLTEQGEVTTASDVWALGLIAFHVLTGQYYWRCANDDSSLLDLYREIQHGPGEPPSARAAALGCGELIPPGFDAWFARCVNLDPAARYPDARAAVAALAAVLEPRPRAGRANRPGPADLPGKVVDGRYELIERLGRGEISEVWRADLLGAEKFRRAVAFKRVAPELVASERSRGILASEARAASLMDHPHVLRVYEFGRDDGGYYLACEWLPGLSLAEWTDPARGAEPADPRAVAAVGAAVLSALAAAHTQPEDHAEGSAPGGPVLHRDVSPSNVRVSVRGAVKLGDFGLARAADWAWLTPEGRVQEKLSYRAPEVLRGAPATEASDLFGCAVLLWEFLCGTRRFAGRADGDVVRLLTTGARLPPVRSLRADVPAGLAEAIDRGAAVDPAQRWHAAREFRAALARSVPEPATTDELAALVARARARESRG